MRGLILELFKGVPVEEFQKLTAKHERTKKTRGKLQAKVQKQKAAYSDLMEAFEKLKETKDAN